MIKLNCDLGESYGSWKMGQDEKVMPLIDMANIACGFHSSDPDIMNKTVALAKKHSTIIGAHPSYPDLVGFGRRSMACSLDEIENMTIFQYGALAAFCKVHQTKIDYIKPHGALYNDMMKDKNIFKALLNSVKKINNDIKLMILSTKNNNEFEEIAKEYSVKLIYEVFADRNYTDEGFLVPRNEKNAVIKDNNEVIQRINLLIKEGKIQTQNGKKIHLKADCMCVHGDNEKALSLIESLREVLNNENNSCGC